jgi:general secretion pathway protein G
VTQQQPPAPLDWEAADESAPRPVLVTHPLPYAAPEPEESGRRVAHALTWVAVVVCLVVLIAIVLPEVTARQRGVTARTAAARTDVASLATAIDTFYVDAGRFPTAAEGLGALMNPPAGVRAWNGPYVRRQPLDPWGNPYLYRTGTSSGAPTYRVDCTGPDGRTGTADDITSGWNNAPTTNSP